MEKKRFKLYKSGKLWCCAAIAFFTMGITTVSNGHVKADTNVPTAQASNQQPVTTNTSTVQSTTPQSTTISSNAIQSGASQVNNSQVMNLATNQGSQLDTSTTDTTSQSYPLTDHWMGGAEVEECHIYLYDVESHTYIYEDGTNKPYSLLVQLSTGYIKDHYDLFYDSINYIQMKYEMANGDPMPALYHDLNGVDEVNKLLPIDFDPSKVICSGNFIEKNTNPDGYMIWNVKPIPKNELGRIKLNLYQFYVPEGEDESNGQYQQVGTSYVTGKRGSYVDVQGIEIRMNDGRGFFTSTINEIKGHPGIVQIPKDDNTSSAVRVEGAIFHDNPSGNPDDESNFYKSDAEFSKHEQP